MKRKTLTLTPPAKSPWLRKKITPANAPGAIDELYAMRERRQAFARLVKEADALRRLLVDEEEELAKAIHAAMRASGAKKLTGSSATFSPQVKPVPVVDDWDELYAYIAEHDAFELLHRRLTVDAFRDRWDESKEIPGVHPEDALSYSLTKAAKK